VKRKMMKDEKHEFCYWAKDENMVFFHVKSTRCAFINRSLVGICKEMVLKVWERGDVRQCFIGHESRFFSLGIAIKKIARR
jgi:hypothetical protein